MKPTGRQLRQENLTAQYLYLAILAFVAVLFILLDVFSPIWRN